MVAVDVVGEVVFVEALATLLPVRFICKESTYGKNQRLAALEDFMSKNDLLLRRKKNDTHTIPFIRNTGQ